ncbi:MAG: shikimate kinase AroL [Syntrophaceae bacterium]|nr:shikimate kinase AroL [Syntrophaceae bacterium]
MKIVLIGCRGAGKSTVGKRLADRLGMSFVDTDDLLTERHGRSITEIVGSQGWDRFRAEEKAIIKEISALDNLVIASGGGSVLDEENVRSFGKNGLIVWLKADPEVLVSRLSRDPKNFFQRPSLTGKGLAEEIREVLTHRNPLYERASSIRLDTSSLTEEAVVEEICSILEKRTEGK